MELPVRAPFRLDLTAGALRRLASNAVDVVASDGTFYRAFEDGQGAAIVAVRQTGEATLEVRATGRNARRWLPRVARMLGTQVDLTAWYERAAEIEWLHRLAVQLRGLKPPRYSTLWEACAHAVVFQQISIHAAASIMRRAVESLGEPIAVSDDVACVAFPRPQRWLEAGDDALRLAGLSRNKVAHLQSIAVAIVSGELREDALEALPTPQAAEMLCAIRGIGPWSAAVILLRGFGRLDTFPMRDSGVARSVALLAGSATGLDDVLRTLGPTSGMLYFHLLLGRLALSARAQPGGAPIRSEGV